MSFDVSGVNWLAVAASSVAGFFLGGIWWMALFGKAWVAAYGFTEEEQQASQSKMARNFTVYLVMGFVIALAMSILFQNLGVGTVMDGAQTGAFVGIGFVATVLLMQVMSGNYKIAAFFIDAGYYVVWFVLTGAIVAGWR